MDRVKRRFVGALWIVGSVLVALYLVRSFVADLYRVESGSMAPFLHGGDALGEWVLVRYGVPDDLERFDLVVTYEGSGKPVVKRVVGLPGETVQVSGGDLFIDRHRLAPETARPHPVTLFDSDLHEIADHFEWDSGSWSAPTDTAPTWRLDTRDRDEASNDHLLRWRSSFDDGYLLPDGIRVAGTRHVGDGLVSCEVDVERMAGGHGTLRLELRERGDLFRALLDLVGEDVVRARIERHYPEHSPDAFEPALEILLHPPEVLAEATIALEASWTRLLFANIDNTLVLEVGDEPALVAEYIENRAPAGAAVVPGVTVGTQVALGGDGLAASFRSLRIARDTHWISRGDFAVDRPLSLGPSEVFLLGDNSAMSLDGRSFGATRLDAVLGRPHSVVWPRSRARSLRDERFHLVERNPKRNAGALE